MKTKKGVSVLAFVCTAACLTSGLLAQQSADPAALFRQLQAPGTTNEATVALLKQGATQVSVRRYLGSGLPPLIEAGWKSSSWQVWKNEVRLAGELKITETAPALAKWISLDSVGETSAGQFERLQTNPAGKALAQIGDPAIPSLVSVLGTGTVRERRSAYFALNLIDSPSAKAAMRDRLDSEDDASLRDFLEKALRK